MTFLKNKNILLKLYVEQCHQLINYFVYFFLKFETLKNKKLYYFWTKEKKILLLDCFLTINVAFWFNSISVMKNIFFIILNLIQCYYFYSKMMKLNLFLIFQNLFVSIEFHLKCQYLIDVLKFLSMLQQLKSV